MFRFFDLPAELRSAILEHILVSDCGIILRSETSSRLPFGNLQSALNVFVVCMQMYQEASAIFYTQNRFILNAQSHRLPSHLTSPGGFLSPQGQDARRRVHGITLFLSRVGGEFGDVLGPALSDMVLCGSLRELKLCIGAPPSLHPSRTSDMDLVQRPPFQALLRLLSDPYLEVVELLVWKVHWAFLCPFHRKGDNLTGEGPNSESVDDLGLATVRQGPEWVPVDWKSMVASLGTGQQIVRIGERGF
ncbi:Uu.00g029530.m01.CDS01 [Anthostomella pinea]|uniref:Uu.00g029530.m01.CDS01 n=1 Tax=Anthostomella pinea TaxID=933095 RepID=A0AAI8YCV2_9PEZI|nr:Uu.00g029530.m01.CDS01 [Anthostomella pinea]